MNTKGSPQREASVQSSATASERVKRLTQPVLCHL